jgi:hypothetical protein
VLVTNVDGFSFSDNRREVLNKEVSKGDILPERRATAIETWYDGQWVYSPYGSRRSC